ncbi:MAG: hypothetical protein EZS28_033344 [Streblomastix strix]|uniref:Serpin domain-containing protein n=1 Tax=Streblomastix strix TaxID=222440 RepID=A0A5J4UKU7_9EUKA|nr:MAG: hypothetical protein EZS28_033344 [Streblomastix strix]
MIYTRLDDIAAISLPFNLEGIEMMIILPYDKSPEAFLQAALKYLSSDGLRKIKANGNITKVHLSLPKFGIKFKMDAFNNNAKFPHICNHYLRISNIKHEAVLKINEEGAEAIAATEIEMYPTLQNCTKIEMEQQIYFTVDHPFLFAIYETHSHMSIFTGMIKTIGNADVEAEMKVDL